MNKKFSTLVAGVLLATTVGTANAQVASTDSIKYETGKYYVLAGGAGGPAATADSVLSVTRLGDKYIYSMSSSRTNSLTEIDSALWLATITTKPGSSTPTFQFTNKATGVPLSINPDQASKKGVDAKTDSLVAGGSVFEWKHSPVLGKPERSTLSSALDGDSSVVLGVTTTGNHVVAYRAGNGEVNGAVGSTLNYSPLKLQVFAAAPVYLNASDLNTMMAKVKDANAYKDGWFKLNYNPALVGSVNVPNIFDQQLQAVPAKNGTLAATDYTNAVTANDSVYLKVKNKKVDDNQAFAMLDTAYFNLNVPADTMGNKYRRFVYADTTATAVRTLGTGSVTTGLPQFAFKFQYFPSQDSIAIYTSSAAKRRLASDGTTYWKDASNSPQDTVVSIVTLVSGLHTEFSVGAAKDASGQLSSDGAGVKFSFGQDIANVASIPTGYYYIKNLNADSPVLSDKKKDYYFTIGLDSTLTYLPDGNKAWMSASQWFVNTNSSYSLIANREFAPVAGGVINTALASVPAGLFYKGKDYSASNLVVTDINGNEYKFEAIAAADLAKSAYYDSLEVDGTLEKKSYAMKYFTGFDAISAFVNIKEDSTLNVKEAEKAEQYFELVRLKFNTASGKEKELETYTTIKNAAGDKIDKLSRAAYKIKVKKAIGDSSADEYVVLDGNKYKISSETGGSKAEAAVFFLKRTTKEDYFALIDTAVFNSKTAKAKTSKVVVSDATSSVNDLEYIELSGRTSSFALTVEDEPLYRRLGDTKKDDGFTDMTTDTAKIYLTRNNERFLYENTKNNIAGKATGINYLGEYNDKQFDNAAALFIDTAYVRGNTKMPQYMIALRPQFGKWIPCPADDAHADKYEYQVKADYLVNLSDSVNSSVRKDELFQFETKTRLAFVPAIHHGDSLIITDSKFTGNNEQIVEGEEKTWAGNDTINLKPNTRNHVAFQFRLVDGGDAADFYIESCKEDGVYSFVQLLNGVPVLTSNIADAERFNIASTKDVPTANEGIETTEVSVVAGSGSVVVNNAAGKTIAISNILGQTIANTVITSDNATIAVPAGIVVVSVEGEEAVKAIVK